MNSLKKTYTGIVILLVAQFALIANATGSADQSAVAEEQSELSTNREGLLKSTGADPDAPVALVENKITLQGEGLFSFNSDFLQQGTERVLLGLVNTLEGMENIVSIEVIGHTDSTGSKSTNKRISLSRAKTIQAFLQGAYPEVSINAVGLGESSPAFPNETLKGRKLNRRVDIIVSTPAPAN